MFCSLNQRYLYVACLAGKDITHRNILATLNWRQGLVLVSKIYPAITIQNIKCQDEPMGHSIAFRGRSLTFKISDP